jgi:DNA-binding response OmpR family regulator
MADILIVDDEPDIRMLLGFALEDAGHTVRQASDGAEALEELARRAPDLVVLDVMMPSVDGIGVLKARRQHGLAPDTRFVLLTCRSGERDFAKGWENGADAYLTKPFSNDTLMATIRTVLRASPEDLAAKREAEIEKAELLDRIESVFSRPAHVRAV